MGAELRKQLRLRPEVPTTGWRVTVNTTGVGWGITLWVDVETLDLDARNRLWRAACAIVAPHEHRYSRDCNDGEYPVYNSDRLNFGWARKRRSKRRD